jgi:hypothetical protein
MILLSGRVCTLLRLDPSSWLDRAFAYCPIFSTADVAPRRVTLVSVPLWLAVLSNQLCIIDLVGRYHHQLSITG